MTKKKPTQTLKEIAWKIDNEGLDYAILEGYAGPVSDDEEWNRDLAAVEPVLRRMQNKVAKLLDLELD